MSDGTTYDARVYRTEVYKGKTVTTYHVRWKVGGKLWREGFRTAAQADSFRSALLTAARKGKVFSLATGRPVAWERTKAATTWYEFACLYVDMKWKLASAKYRKDIARALTTATPVMLAEAAADPTTLASAGRSSGGASTPSSAPNHPARLPRSSHGWHGTVRRCQRWPRLLLPAGCSTRQRADWMGRTRQPARPGATARS